MISAECEFVLKLKSAHANREEKQESVKVLTYRQRGGVSGSGVGESWYDKLFSI